MWYKKYNIGIDTVDKQHKDIYDLIEELSELITKESLVSDNFKYFDDLFIELLIHLNYENNLMKNSGDVQYEEHILEHNRVLSEFTRLYVDKIKTNEEYMDIVSEFGVMLMEHLEIYDRNLVQIEDKNINDENLSSCSGGVIVVIYENGYFFKTLGEVDESLMNKLIDLMNNQRSEEYYNTTEWIIINDLREWDYLTYRSSMMVKEYSLDNSKKNKKFTIYITGNSKLNDYLIGNISDNKKEYKSSVKDLQEVFVEVNRHKFDIGDVVGIECLGNCNLFNKN